MLNYLLDQLLRGRRALISPFINAKLSLVKNLVERAVAAGRSVLIVDPQGLLARLQLVDLSRKGVFYAESLDFVKNTYPFSNFFILEPHYLPKLHGINDVLVTTHVRSMAKLHGFYTRVYLKRLFGSTYLIELADTMERFRLRITGGVVEAVENKPSGFVGRVYEVLKNSLMEYGELKVKDAVNVLKHELGLTKQQALMYLRKLASERFIEVKKGYVTVY